jgi:hypothetical protein
MWEQNAAHRCPEPDVAGSKAFEKDCRSARTRRRHPGMRAHLKGCPACQEDRESLAALVGSQSAQPGSAGATIGRSAR